MNSEAADMLDRVLKIIIEKRQPFLELMGDIPGDSWALRVTNAMTELHNTIDELRDGDTPRTARSIWGWLEDAWSSMRKRPWFNCAVILQGPGSPRVYLIRLESTTADGILRVLRMPEIPALGSENPEVPGLFCVDRTSEAMGSGLYKVTATYGPKPPAVQSATCLPAGRSASGSAP